MMRIAVLLGVLFVFVGIAPTKAEDASCLFRGTASVEAFDKYLGGASAQVVNNNPSVQPHMRLTHCDSGLYADVWASVGLNSADMELNKSSSEIDYAVGWAGDLPSGFRADIQIFYWDVGPFPKFGHEDLTGGTIRLSYLKETGILSVAPYVQWKPQYFFLLGEWKNDINIGAEFNVPITEGIRLGSFAEANFQDAFNGGSTGWIWQVGGKLTWVLTENLSLDAPKVRIAGPMPFETFGDGRQTQWVVGMGVNYNF